MDKIRGTWAMLNDKDKRVWIGGSIDIDKHLTRSLSLIRTVGRIQDEAYPAKIKFDVMKYNGTAIDRCIYVNLSNMEAIEEEIRKHPEHTRTRVDRFIKELSKLYVRYELYNEYENYSQDSWFEANKTFYTNNRMIMIKLVSSGIITLHTFEENQIKKEEVKPMENKSNFDQLIEIECILRDKTKEELLESLISEKAKKIYEIVGNVNSAIKEDEKE